MSASSKNDTQTDPIVIDNYINGEFVPPQNRTSYMNVSNPSTGSIIGKVAVSDHTDVDHVVQIASRAQEQWKTQYTMKARAAIILKFHALVQQHSMELAQYIVQENGKNITEALADVAKGNETVEYAGSIANGTYGSGRILPVSSGNIQCEDQKQPIGVVVCIVPFNFPFMVPMWTIPIALVLGNTVIVKPSEKVPITLYHTMKLWEQAGLPAGCLNLIQGTKSAVEALIAHPTVKGVTFVGSSSVAESIAQQCCMKKRCIALGGAKNHLIALSDCHITSTAQDIVTSFCGCAGQRCMAASVLLLVNSTETNNGTTGATTLSSSSALQTLIDTIVKLAAQLQPGTSSGQMGPVIDDTSYEKIVSYIEYAIKDGAKVLLDGRIWERRQHPDGSNGSGNWIGPTILLHTNSTDRTMVEEVFGPVLSIYHCSSWMEAIQIENHSPYGNAASIYTTNGGHAQYFLSRCKAAMLGCNIGIPVPREPFSFGGLYGTKSKYGSYPGDITGDAAIEFFTNRIKITSKWPSIDPTIYSTTVNNTSSNKKLKLTNGDTSSAAIDHANFAGRM